MHKEVLSASSSKKSKVEDLQRELDEIVSYVS